MLLMHTVSVTSSYLSSYACPVEIIESLKALFISACILTVLTSSGENVIGISTSGHNPTRALESWIPWHAVQHEHWTWGGAVLFEQSVSKYHDGQMSSGAAPVNILLWRKSWSVENVLNTKYYELIIVTINTPWYSPKGACDKLSGIVPSSLLFCNWRYCTLLVFPNPGIFPVRELSCK